MSDQNTRTDGELATDDLEQAAGGARFGAISDPGFTITHPVNPVVCPGPVCEFPAPPPYVPAPPVETT